MKVIIITAKIFSVIITITLHVFEKKNMITVTFDYCENCIAQIITITYYDYPRSDSIIIASLKSEPTCKLINRIPGVRVLISSLPGSAFRTHVKPLGKPRDSISVLEAMPG